MNERQTAEWLMEREDFLILTHVRPDGDTIGCAAGLCLALRGRGKTAWVLENPEATSLFTPYLEGLTAPEGWSPDTVVSVDIAARGLFPENARCYLERVDLAIDHHPSQEFFARETCLDAGRAACGELIYDIAGLLGPVTREMAVPLYVAVSTDTGCFVYGNTTADTHRTAATLKRLRIESRIVEGMELFDGGETAVAAVDLAMVAQLGADERDLEDIASFVGQVEGVKNAITIRELRPGTCKLSLRTDPEVLNASRVCALLGGGGHAAASGATVEGSVEEAKRAILWAIEQVRHG